MSHVLTMVFKMRVRRQKENQSSKQKLFEKEGAHKRRSQSDGPAHAS